jgi:hypothetical protein
MQYSIEEIFVQCNLFLVKVKVNNFKRYLFIQLMFNYVCLPLFYREQAVEL